MSAQNLMEKRNGKPLKILIVDDEKNVRDVFRDFCTSSTYFDVTTASGGQEAIDVLTSQDFDIVTIDLVMPEISGIDALEKIKKEKPALPVMIITGNATEHLIQEVGRFAACRVMHKPVGIDDFVNEIMDLAEERCQ